jgi:predicted nuclease of predicted toxin-antitoxin system
VKFLTDVNASGILAQWLVERGHDVSVVSDKDPRMTDDDILNWAVEEQRIIITTDNDFEEMVWRERRLHCGILRLENLPRAERKLLLEEVFELYSRELLSGAIVIAQKKRFRVRRYSE